MPDPARAALGELSKCATDATAGLLDKACGFQRNGNHRSVVFCFLVRVHYRSYHGLGLNVNTDLEPFLRINPCGYQGMQMTRMSDFGLTQSVDQAGTELAPVIAKLLDYTHIQWDK